MAVRSAIARWEGDLRGGGGTMALGSAAFEGQYSYRSRFEDGAGTNPEELIGAAHAGGFTLGLPHMLAQGAHTPHTVAHSQTRGPTRATPRPGSRRRRAFTSSPSTACRRSPGSSSPPRATCPRS